MCNSCITNWGVCACEGGGVFAVCPASKGVSCPICNHDPRFWATEPIRLAELLKPAMLARAREEFRAAEKQAGRGE